VLIHFNPVRGESAEDSRQHLDRVLAISPFYGEARYHAMEFAARDGKGAVFDSLFRTIDRKNAQFLPWQAVRAFTWGSPREQDAALRALRGDDLASGLAAARLAAHTHDFAAAERVADQLNSSAGLPVWRAGALLMSAQTRLARGDWPGAEEQLARAGELERDWTRELTALYLLHPAAGASRERLLQEVRRLEEWRPVGERTPATSFFFRAHALVHPVLRFYLIGLLNAAAGEKDAAAAAQDSLIRYRGDEIAMRLANALQSGLRGHIMRANGDAKGALNQLTRVSLDSPPEAIAVSPFYSRAWDRWVLAELYREAGDAQNAAKWYETLIDGYDYVYSGIAHERLADISRASGDTNRAAFHAGERDRLRRPAR